LSAITLGCFDADVSETARNAYIAKVTEITHLSPLAANSHLDKLTWQPFVPAGGLMSVADVQKGLKAIGFFPIGTIDGICGYRTQSAIRLFQEYVRSVEKVADVVPDGQFGPATQAHLQRWLAGALKSTWTQTIEQFQAGSPPQPGYTAWLALLEKVKQKYLTSPSKMLQKVNAFSGVTCTNKVAAWDFGTPSNVHLIGIRRDGFDHKFEDIFVLLINGLIFKFQGTTDPGAPGNSTGYAFLVQGQHTYRFGWHKETYLALKPQSAVLVVRSKVDTLTDADLSRDLEANDTINVHWGGPGMARDVSNWSEGCQVVNGSVYFNPAGDLINCSKFAATGSLQPTTNPDQTRGAYNVLLDLVNTMSSDQNSTLRYMLLVQEDLDLDPTLKASLDDSRSRFMKLLNP
jgi:hypothetical protein